MSSIYTDSQCKSSSLGEEGGGGGLTGAGVSWGGGEGGGGGRRESFMQISKHKKKTVKFIHF